MKRIGVLANHKRDVETVQQNIVSWLIAENAEAVTPQGEYDVVDQTFLHDFLSGAAKDCDCLLVLGGDGTLLSVSRQAALFSMPILGINMGHVGFLAEIEPKGQQLYQSLRRLLDDEFVLESRMMLKVAVYRDGKPFQEYHCLNDCVVIKTNNYGLIHLDAYIDEKPSLSYNGDGLIVSTPTGASGYSLSAGGPLVSPEMAAMILTPIAAHCLYCRSLVIDANHEVMLETNASEIGGSLCIDGKTFVLPLTERDRVYINQSELKTDFIRFNDKSYFQVLNEKLRERA